MSENSDKSINEFFEQFKFKNLLNKKELPQWEKNLLKKIWELKDKDDGTKFSGDTVKNMIREFALNNRSDLEKKISIKQNGEE